MIAHSTRSTPRSVSNTVGRAGRRKSSVKSILKHDLSKQVINDSEQAEHIGTCESSNGEQGFVSAHGRTLTSASNVRDAFRVLEATNIALKSPMASMSLASSGHHSSVPAQPERFHGKPKYGGSDYAGVTSRHSHLATVNPGASGTEANSSRSLYGAPPGSMLLGASTSNIGEVAKTSRGLNTTIRFAADTDEYDYARDTAKPIADTPTTAMRLSGQIGISNPSRSVMRGITRMLSNSGLVLAGPRLISMGSKQNVLSATVVSDALQLSQTLRADWGRRDTQAERQELALPGTPVTALLSTTRRTQFRSPEAGGPQAIDIASPAVHGLLSMRPSPNAFAAGPLSSRLRSQGSKGSTSLSPLRSVHALEAESSYVTINRQPLQASSPLHEIIALTEAGAADVESASVTPSAGHSSGILGWLYHHCVRIFTMQFSNATLESRYRRRAAKSGLRLLRTALPMFLIAFGGIGSAAMFKSLTESMESIRAINLLFMGGVTVLMWIVVLLMLQSSKLEDRLAASTALSGEKESHGRRRWLPPPHEAFAVMIGLVYFLPNNIARVFTGTGVATDYDSFLRVQSNVNFFVLLG